MKGETHSHSEPNSTQLSVLESKLGLGVRLRLELILQLPA